MSGSSAAAGALVAGLGCLVASPYLARLTLSVPDRDDPRWWTGRDAGPRRTAATAGCALLIGAAAGDAAGFAALLPAWLALALLATPLVVVDVEHHRLPNRLVHPAAVAGACLLTLAAGVRGDWPPLLRALEGAAAVFAVLAALVLISPDSFGRGDVRLGAVLAGYLGWFGWSVLVTGIVAAFLLGGLVGVALLVTRRGDRRTPIAFGPMLVAGALAVAAAHGIGAA